jgi:hypothetical protein
VSFLIERYFQILDNHEVYQKIVAPNALSYFAERHVICVWSYNTLLRSLQRDLVAQSMPLNSEPQKLAIRLVTEMVLDEEVDDLGDGSYQSHMELYLEAMRDINCDISQLFLFFDLLAQEKEPQEIFDAVDFAPEVAKYAQVMMNILNMPLHMRAAALFYEGEPYIPDSFLFGLWQLKNYLPVGKFIEYFERHIEGLKWDGYSLSGRLVEVLCSFDTNLNRDAERIAEIVMKNRIELWNSISKGLDALPAVPVAAANKGRYLRLVR